MTSDIWRKLNALIEAHMAAEMAAEERTHRFGKLLPWGEPFRALVNNPSITPYLEELLGERFRLDHDYADIIRPGTAQRGPIGTTLHGGGTPFDPSQYYQFREGRMYNGLTVVAYNLRDVHPAMGALPACRAATKATSDSQAIGATLDVWEARPQSL